MVSERTIEANQQNSKKSTGPRSPGGKDRARFNALKSGLFTRQLVIESLGEEQRDFDSFRAQIWESLQPKNAISSLLTEDIVALAWRLQRVNRCEAAEIRRQRDTAKGRLLVEKLAELESLKSRFLREWSTLWVPEAQVGGSLAVFARIEETRKELERTSLGIRFLRGLIESIQREVEEKGVLSSRSESTLLVLCSVSEEAEKSYTRFNLIAKDETEKMKIDPSADKARFESNRDLFSQTLKAKIEFMRVAEQELHQLETAEEASHLATLAMPPAERSEQIFRAEAALSRRLFQTMHLALAMKGLDLAK
jgi:hypothetical protein